MSLIKLQVECSDDKGTVSDIINVSITING